MTEMKKYFTHKKYGGYSDCICNSELKHPWWNGAVISNCTGFCWGMFNMARGTKDKFKRLYGNAGTLYAAGKKSGSGFLVGYEPKADAIAVYGAGTKAGHVVYLLHNFGSGHFIGLESNYSGSYSNALALRVKYGNPKHWYKEYKGCIYDFT